MRLSRGPGLLIDLDEIAAALRGGELSAVEQAAALPRGVLLEGLGGDSLELDDWLSRERPRWQRSISQLLATTLLRDPRRGRSVGRAENMTSRTCTALSCRRLRAAWLSATAAVVHFGAGRTLETFPTRRTMSAAYVDLLLLSAGQPSQIVTAVCVGRFQLQASFELGARC